MPTEGNILIDGNDTKDEKKLWDIRQTAGMVFQNPDNQIVATVVEEDVAFGPENLGIDPQLIRQRVKEALESVGITELKDRQPHLLSGGQKQRVAIAGIVMDKGRKVLEGTPKEVFRNVKMLKEIGLDVPYMTELATSLREEGIEINDDILTVDEMVVKLCRLL